MAEPTTSAFPSSLDDDTSLLKDVVNQKTLTLGEDLDDSETTITMSASISGITAPCYILIDSEIIHCGSINGADFEDCTRGADGSTATTHDNGTTVYHVFNANYHNQLKAAIIAAQTEMGVQAGSGVALSKRRRVYAYIEVFDMQTPTAVETGDGKRYIGPIGSYLNGMNLVEVGAMVATAPSGGPVTVQIHNLTDTVDMLTTEITIDDGETDTSTAETAADIDEDNDDLDTNDVLRIDVDAANSAEGLIVMLGFE